MKAQAFRDRRDAGRRLAALLDQERLRRERVVVLGIPRGGLVVAFEVARALRAPLDVVCVRPLSTPGEPDLHLGALGEAGEPVVNGELAREAGLTGAALGRLVAAERAALAAQERRYRVVRPRLPLTGRTALLVDDGVTTGVSAVAAARGARARGPRRVGLAVPVSSPEALGEVAEEVDEVACLEQPPLTLALEEWYEEFPEVSVEEVVELLAQAARWPWT
ncbi:MAG TPA: phosphoribosyltransferase family protein [Candidatus Dormibacteraeota bacterium]|nr:phosphoribosyltransferase family protein [Candidatus Dormibacteraeota bacterium]